MICVTSFFSISLIISFVLMLGAYFTSYESEAKRLDVSWGLGIAAITLFTFIYDGSFAPKKILITLLALASSLRLSFYMLYRSGEDNPRYAALKAKLKNSLVVFLVQAVLVWLVSFPMIYVNSDASGALGILSFIGLFFWSIGFIYEAVADYQLNKFLSDPRNTGQVLRSGLWKLCRHPNYFGQFLISWGLWFFAALHFKALISPVINYLLIKKFCGIPDIEKKMYEKIPSYLDYMKKTNILVPWFSDDYWDHK